VIFVLWTFACLLAQQPQSPDSSIPSLPPAKPEVIDIPLETSATTPPANSNWPKITIPSYASCPIPELQQMVKELAQLKAASDQAELSALLDKIGAKTKEIVSKTPNLISHESVITEQNRIKTRKDYSYLVVTHVQGTDTAVFDEYRVDLATGKKFETADVLNDAPASSSPSSLSLQSSFPPRIELGGAPTDQGFATDWLNFYPSNHPQSNFRYLGQQKMDGHQTVVVSFAQKPSAVRVPGMLRLEDKTVPMFMQGIAWVDASDFRIVRLRTDLLAPPPHVDLRQLTADIHFSEIRIAEAATPMWLPGRVVITSNLAGMIVRESHSYSGYRLFRAHTKILLNP
jgi:hypothetical protein